MQVETIASPERLHALCAEWEALWRRDPHSTPFQHPGWLLPWWDRFGSGRLFTFAVRQGGRVVGLAPLFLHPWNGRRQVTFLGNGVSDYLDFLLDPDSAPAAAAALLDAVAAQAEHWDLCDLQDLACHSPLQTAPIPAALESRICPQYPCSSIALPATVEQFHEGLPHGLKRNLRRYRSQLDACGQVRLQTAGEREFDQYLDALFHLHRARWSMQNDPGMLHGAAMEEFHREAARHLAAAGLVRLHSLLVNDQVAAITYILVHAGHAYSYLGGFDPELRKFSPGALILEYTIEQAIQEGCTGFDFLRGAEAYKSDWGARPSVTSRLLLWPAGAAPPA